MTTQSNPLGLRDGEKFSVIAVIRCESTVKSREDLPDGSLVLPGVTPLVDDWWQGQIGEIQYNQLGDCTLALVRHASSEHPEEGQFAHLYIRTGSTRLLTTKKALACCKSRWS